jgi:hypothetical protein
MTSYATKTRESEIEADLTEAVSAKHGRAYKFTSPGRRAVPDRLVLMPIENEEHRAIVAKYVRFVELKAAGGVPTKPQIREHEKLFRLGHVVVISSDTTHNDEIVNSMS